ncbi:hypothetical protein IWQ57_005313, partial [Coemansia nantahalensis]
EAYYDIERILDHAPMSRGRFKYLVRWKGFGPTHDEWIPESNFPKDSEIQPVYKQHVGKWHSSLLRNRICMVTHK